MEVNFTFFIDFKSGEHIIHKLKFFSFIFPIIRLFRVLFLPFLSGAWQSLSQQTPVYQISTI